MNAHVRWTGDAVSEYFRTHQAATKSPARPGRDQDWPEDMRRLLASGSRPPTVTARD
jgi:hypothetical protein